MGIRPIRTNKEHRAALAEIEALWGAPEGSEQGDRLDALVDLVVAYEQRLWPITPEERRRANVMRKQPMKKLDRPKAPQRNAKPPAAANPRLAAQTRKILGKHYANKYRVR